MTMDPTQREGRFRDFDRGGSVIEGYRDVTKQDPFNKKFLARNYRAYKVLKKGGLGKKKGLRKLKRMSDTQLENLAAKAVLKDMGVKRRKLRTSFNRKKHNIKWAKKVMAQRARGDTPKKRALRRTKAARQHIRTIRRNRQYKGKPIFPGVPKGF